MEKYRNWYVLTPFSNFNKINAFVDSKIEEIYFPANLKELKEGRCEEIKCLKKIIISPSNGQFEFKDDKYLICKSEPNNNEFDNLLFVRRDIEEFSIPANAFENSNIKEISIPSKVTTISDRAFSRCKNLKKVELPTNSNLQEIKTYVFSYSNIESISIPSKVSKICNFTFGFCHNLLKVGIPEDSNLLDLLLLKDVHH